MDTVRQLTAVIEREGDGKVRDLTLDTALDLRRSKSGMAAKR